VCQKELILLPNGDIKPAAGFDLASVAGESGAAKGGDAPGPAISEAVKESGTRLLVKKYAAEPAPKAEPPAPAPVARPAAKRPDPLDTPSPVAAPASADADASDESNPLPGWLDDAKGSGGGDDMVKPQPETDMAIDVVQNEVVAGDEDRTVKVEDDPPPPPPVRARSPIAAKMPSVASGRPPASVEAPPPPAEPEVDLLPPDPPKKPAPRFGSSGTRRSPVGAAPAPSAAATVGAEETGGGRVFLALILALLPIAACGGLLASRDKLKHELIAKAGARFVKGFSVLHNRMFPPPPPPKPVIEEKKPEPEPVKEEPPKPDPDQQKKDEAAISTLYTQIIREKRDLKSNLVAASPEQKQQLQQVQRDIEAKEAKLKEKQDLYLKMYGKPYDPTK
jgi:hypothetical protein